MSMAELLDGRGIAMPPIRQVSKTFKKAPKAKAEKMKQNSLLPGSDEQ